MNVPSTHRTTQGRLAGCWAHGDMAKQRRGKPGSIGILATGSDRTDPFLRATGVLLPECWESWPWTEGRTSRETQPPCPRGGWVRGCSSEMTRPQSPGLLTRQRGQSLPVHSSRVRSLSACPARQSSLHPRSLLELLRCGSSAEAGLFFRWDSQNQIGFHKSGRT